MYKKINQCRISGSKNLQPIINLGDQYLTGVFPKSKGQKIGKAPLELVWCEDSELAQLKHTYSLNEMYGENYGYRSGLNQSMVRHLNEKINFLENLVSLKDDDLVIDIGSNDSTTLRSYVSNKIKKVGIDPTGEKFKEFYPDDVHLISSFFPTDKLFEIFPNKRAKIITSISMFYDLEDPLSFVEAITQTLHRNGIWHLEQSYLPTMLEKKSYDTICHEHLEYYTIQSLVNMFEIYDLKIIDIELNDINGGSFALSVAHKDCDAFEINNKRISFFIDKEKELELKNFEIFHKFSENTQDHRIKLIQLLNQLNNDGKKVFGYGASTKGNVLLQYCGINNSHIPFISEINEDKYNVYTPGTNIPIISQSEADKMNPNYYLVLPWHFKNSIIANETEFRKRGGKFIFPLPDIEII